MLKHPAARLDYGYLAGAVLGGGKGGSAPQAPDPAATAAAQAAANKEAVYESARVNQINQVSPYGSTQFTGEIGAPDRTQTLTLPDAAQSALGSQQNVAAMLGKFGEQFAPRVAEGLATPFNTADYGPAPVANDAERQRIEAALMGRLDPQFTKDENALQSRLANRGIGLGSEAYSNAYDDFNRAKTDARLATIGQAGNEYAQDFGLQNQSYQQKLSNGLLNRTQGLNEVSALFQGAPALQNPTAPSPAQYQVAPGDYAGAAQNQYAGQLNNYNQRVGQQNAMMGGIAGLGAAAIAAF